MKLFLDTSVLLAASGSAGGASREVFRLAPANGWTLVATPYVVEEVLRNLPDLPLPASADWVRLRNDLVLRDDVLTLDRPAVFSAAKDRPSFVRCTRLGGRSINARPKRFWRAARQGVLRLAGIDARHVPRARASGRALDSLASSAEADGGALGGTFSAIRPEVSSTPERLRASLWGQHPIGQRTRATDGYLGPKRTC